MRRSIVFFLGLGCLSLVFGACAPDAPHSNPNDPGSPNYNPDGVLTGQVLTLGAPYFGIPNALVFIEQDSMAELTAADGTFDFRNAPTGNVTLVISKQSYLSDTLYLSLQSSKSFDTLVHLDALPQISSPQVVTSKIDQWWPLGAVYSALVTANVSDPDGISDINPDSVYVWVDTLSYPMSYSVADKNWQAVIQGTSLPNQDIQWLVGKELQIVAFDRENGMGTSQPFYLTRIIEAEANPSFPALDSTLTTTAYPTFTWLSPGVPYDYTYLLQVYSNTSGVPTQVGNPISLNSSIYSYDFADSLINGTYFWTIAVVDDFGNSSRSKPSSFTISVP